MSVTLRWGSATDTGRVRELNEDSMLVGDRVFAVADGMGGHAAGEVASLIAIETLRANADASTESVVDAIRQANRAVLTRSEEDVSTRGMGTTLSVVALVTTDHGEEIVVANVGDSRVYRLHQGELEQLSEDHSLVQDLVREGRISPAEARVHPNRNVVTRTIGNDPTVDVDWWEVDPVAGDRYLICSDGLTDEIEDHVIARVLHTERDPTAAANQLVDLANAAGGRDNITVVLVDVVDDGGRSKAASEALGKDASRQSTATVVREPGDRVAARAGSVTPTPTHAPPNRLTWRVVAFVAAVILVIVAAIGGTIWFARNSYYVGLDDGEVTIFRGRPGGVLWIQPTVADHTGLRLGDIEPSRRDEIDAGHEVSSRADAERYVRNVTTTTTTTTTSTTTTSTTSTSNTVPPPPTSTP
jgi:PPM family protein phosphatase